MRLQMQNVGQALIPRRVEKRHFRYNADIKSDDL